MPNSTYFIVIFSKASLVMVDGDHGVCTHIQTWPEFGSRRQDTCRKNKIHTSGSYLRPIKIFFLIFLWMGIFVKVPTAQ
jgi:hypothetical protein